MSLAYQSQQWFPSSVQVTVHQARNLRIKGKNGTNDAYAIIQVAKDKFSTSVAEKCVAPVWREEATFDLPLFHRANADRCTLYVTVMHRAVAGLDKLLGQAVVNLIDLDEDKTRKKTEWFKLFDKNGKADKDRGEVLLDIQFMRNNMTASMFDLSQGKPRSGISKLKDKIRGKKKEGFSDSASAIVPSVTQVMTDSEGENEDGKKNQDKSKKSKLKLLFGPKTNLQRNISQSMSTLGSLPEKNSSISSSRSSGLNVDSPEAKRKFKFLTHNRTSSTDSKASLGPFSLLSRNKSGTSEQSNLCINGNHVYSEEPEPKVSQPGSVRSSVEDVRRSQERSNSDVSVDSLKTLSLPSYRLELQQVEAQQAKQSEVRVKEEAKRQLDEQEDQRKQEATKKMQLEEEKRKLEAEEKRRLEELEKKKLEELRRQEELQKKKQEELRMQEELKRQEEMKVSDRLTSLFGIGRKKEDDRPEKPPRVLQEVHSEMAKAPLSPTNPFEEIPLSPENNAESQPELRSSPKPSTSILSRTPKVSAVKPRLAVSLKAETQKEKPLSPLANAESLLDSFHTSLPSLSSVSSESPDTFQVLHSSLAPPKARHNSTEMLTSRDESSKVPLPISQISENPPPKYKARSVMLTQSEMDVLDQGVPKPASRGPSPKMEDTDGISQAVSQQNKSPTFPLPDYDSLNAKKKHGVQGSVRWDQIIAEVNLRQRESPPVSDSFELSVDGPDQIQPDLSGNLNEEDLNLTKKTETGSMEAKTQTKNNAAAPWKQAFDSSVTEATQLTPDALVMQPSSSRNKEPMLPPNLTETQVNTKQNDDAKKPRLHISRLPLNQTSNTDATKEQPSVTKAISEIKSELPSDGALNEELVHPSKYLAEAQLRLKQRQSVQRPGLTIDRPNQFASRVFSVATPKVHNHDAPLSPPATLKCKDKVLDTVFSEYNNKKEVESLQKDDKDLVSLGNMEKSDVIPAVKFREQFVSLAVENCSVPIVMESEQKGGGLKAVDQKLSSNDTRQSMANQEPENPVLLKTPQERKSSKQNVELFAGEESVDDPPKPLEKTISVPKRSDIDKRFAESSLVLDPFSDDPFFKKDSWVLPFKPNDLLTDRSNRKEKPTKSGMTVEELERIFEMKDEDPFAAGFDSISSTNSPGKMTVSENAPIISDVNSKGKDLHPSHHDMTSQSLEELPSIIGPTAIKLKWEPDMNLDTTVAQGSKDPFAMDPFLPASPSSGSAKSMETKSSQITPVTWGKGQARAWVSPSEAQPITLQGSSGGPGSETSSATRRPHAVKPLSTLENQAFNLGWDSKPAGTLDLTSGLPKLKVMESDRYAQLTQEELIVLVEKQQAELGKKEGRIVELEEYIDNLLVRVMEEKPSILMSINTTKMAF